MQQLQAVGEAQTVDHAAHVNGAAVHGETVGLAVTRHHQDGGFGQEKELTGPEYEAFLVMEEAVTHLRPGKPAEDFAQHGTEGVFAIVERTLLLVDRAEYKRRQAAPGVKLRPRAFGRDWRIPITNRWRG